jgi:Holliday junction DNA helicase RuvB
MIDRLFNTDTKYFLIGEIDKLKKSDQAVLFNVMEIGFLSETKLKEKTRQKKVKVWVYATSNDVERLSKPLRSRFLELHLQEYTFEEFSDIARRLLAKRYQLEVNLAEEIAYAVWQRMKSKDIRDAINIAKLAKTNDDIDWLVNIQMKYGSKRIINDH